MVISLRTGAMKTAKRHHKSRRIRIGKPYLCGEDLVIEYNESINNYTQEELDRKYGRNPWFLLNPTYPPPYKNFFAVTEDVAGRLYNFPQGRENEAHVCVPKMKARSTTGRDVLFPVDGDVVTLKDGRSFEVRELVTFHDRRNTAIIYIIWSQ